MLGQSLRKAKKSRIYDGKEYVLEEALRADFTLIRAAKADKFGNLIYNKTAQNFNPMMAAAGKFTIAEVEEIVETGDLDPAQIHTPSIYVQGLFKQRKKKELNV